MNAPARSSWTRYAPLILGILLLGLGLALYQTGGEGVGTSAAAGGEAGSAGSRSAGGSGDEGPAAREAGEGSAPGGRSERRAGQAGEGEGRRDRPPSATGGGAPESGGAAGGGAHPSGSGGGGEPGSSTGEGDGGRPRAGRLDASAIRSTIREQLGQFRFCFEWQLHRHPELEGRVTMRFVIGPDGRVTEAGIADDALGDATVARCFQGIVHRMQFPAPEDGGSVTVNYPFVLNGSPEAERPPGEPERSTP